MVNIPTGRRVRLTVAAFCGLGAGVVSHDAHSVTTYQKSAYTAVDRKACKVLPAGADETAFLCHGLDGFPVYLAERDGRTYVASGTEPDKSKASRQSLKFANSPFAHPTDRATIEWRFVIREQRKVPFAMIVRHFTQDHEHKGEVLVVTRIAGAEACQIAYVDALANGNAIVLARKIADDRARKFDCSKGPSIEGEQGRSPM